MVQLIKMIINLTQDNMSNEKYKEVFEGLWDAHVQQGGNLGHQPGLIEAEAQIIAGPGNIPDPNDIDEATLNVENKVKACFMLSGADNARHKELKQACENAYTMGRDEFPSNTTDLLAKMNTYRAIQPKVKLVREYHTPRDEDGLNFAQGEKEDEAEEGVQMLINSDYDESEAWEQDKPSRQRRRRNRKKKQQPAESAGVTMAAPAAKESVPEETMERKVCVHCGSIDHNLDTCPEITDEQLAQILMQLDDMGVEEGQGAMIFQRQRDETRTQPSIGGLRSSRLYLDTCTTNDQITNPAYLTGIYTETKPLTMHTNAGSSLSRKRGKLGSLLFWLNEGGIASVVSLRTLENKFHVKYDSKVNRGCFVCETLKGSVIFKRCERTGFPYVDLDDESNDSAVTLVQTVRTNYKGYTRREVEQAIQACKLQARAPGHPSEKVFKREVSPKSPHSLFATTTITTKDISNARKIFGPSLPCASGKWVRSKSLRVDPDYVSVPPNLLTNKYETLGVDVMFVCGLPFLVSLGRRTRLVTIQFVPRRTSKELANVIVNIIKLYANARAGFVCQTALMDGEFEKVRDELLDKIVVNICSKNEHVPDIERKIRHVKERCRCIKADQPVKVLPNVIIKHIVLHGVMFLNAYVDPQGSPLNSCQGKSSSDGTSLLIDTAAANSVHTASPTMSLMPPSQTPWKPAPALLFASGSRVIFKEPICSWTSSPAKSSSASALTNYRCLIA